MTKYISRDLILESETKNLYTTDQNEYIIQEFVSEKSDSKKKKSKIPDTAKLRNEISSYLFEYLEGYHIPSHFVKNISEHEMLVKRTENIPLIVNIYNYITPSLCKRFDLKEGAPLHFSIFEYYYKNKEYSKTPINETHNFSLEIVSAEEFKIISRLSSKANAIIRALSERRNLILAEIELEFGRKERTVIITNEISPITCRFWNLTEDGKIHRDHFSHTEEKATESFLELRDRLMHKI